MDITHCFFYVPGNISLFVTSTTEVRFDQLSFKVTKIKTTIIMVLCPKSPTKEQQNQKSGPINFPGPPSCTFTWQPKQKGSHVPSCTIALTVELLTFPSQYTSLPPNLSWLNAANCLALEHEYAGGHRLIYSLCERK